MKIDGDDLVKGVILSEVLSEEPPERQGAPAPSSPRDALVTWVALFLVGIGLVVLLVLIGVVWTFVARVMRGGS